MVCEEQAVGELDLVRVRSLGDRDLPEDSRPAGVGDVDDARPDAEVAHVTDVQHVAAAHDLHPVAAAVEVAVADELEAMLLEWAGKDGHGHRPRLWPV